MGFLGAYQSKALSGGSLLAGCWFPGLGTALTRARGREPVGSGQPAQLRAGLCQAAQMLSVRISQLGNLQAQQILLMT